MSSANSGSLPLLLPYSQPIESLWEPTRYLEAPQPPPQDLDKQHDLELAMQRQGMDGKALKKTRPRRTVDYAGGLGRYALLKRIRPNPHYLPYVRPSPSYIIDVLPTKAYADNASTSLLTKFVHTSTNKIRCPVNVVTWTPEGRRILTGSTSGEFTLWNGLTFNFETILQAHDTAIRAMEFTHSGSYLASADQSGTVKYFQPNMNNLAAWQGHREAVRGLSFSPDDSRFATASDDSTIKLWAFDESREERVLSGHGWDVRCVQWHPTKGLLVSGSKDNLIKFWDPRTGTCLSTLHQHKNTVQALSWSPNGEFVASASRDQTVSVFDIRAMKEFRVFRGHKKEVCSLTWHPFHPILVSGGSEGALLHWDLYSAPPIPSQPNAGAPRATLSQAHDSNIWSLAFHPLGHILCSGSNDHTTRFWCRERPGDPQSVFSGGGEKPPEIDPNAAEEDFGDMMLPGLGAGGGGNGGDLPGFGGASGYGDSAWGGKDEDGYNYGAGGGGYYGGPSGGASGSDPQGSSYDMPPGMGTGGGSAEDFIPGFGGGTGAHNNSASLPGFGNANNDPSSAFSLPPGFVPLGSRPNAPMSSQDDFYGTGGGGGGGRGGGGWGGGGAPGKSGGRGGGGGGPRASGGGGPGGPGAGSRWGPSANNHNNSGAGGGAGGGGKKTRWD